MTYLFWMTWHCGQLEEKLHLTASHVTGYANLGLVTPPCIARREARLWWRTLSLPSGSWLFFFFFWSQALNWKTDPTIGVYFELTKDEMAISEFCQKVPISLRMPAELALHYRRYAKQNAFLRRHAKHFQNSRRRSSVTYTKSTLVKMHHSNLFMKANSFLK